jgi:hypothetical protein
MQTFSRSLLVHYNEMIRGVGRNFSGGRGNFFQGYVEGVETESQHK